MTVACHLRALRGERSLRQVAEEAGVNRGLLSEIERGLRLPPDSWIEPLERTYGVPVEQWYDRRTLLVLRLEEDEE